MKLVCFRMGKEPERGCGPRFCLPLEAIGYRFEQAGLVGIQKPCHGLYRPPLREYGSVKYFHYRSWEVRYVVVAMGSLAKT